MENQNKELDLIDLLKTAGRCGKKFTAWLGKATPCFIRFNIRHIILIGIFTAFGVGLTVYKFIPQNRGLKASFILHINVNKSYETADIVQELNLKLDEYNGNPKLAKALKINANEAKEIKQIMPYFVIDINKDNTIDFVDFKGAYADDTLPRRMKSYLCVEIETFKPINFEPVKQAIVTYLNETPYLKAEAKKRLETRKRQIENINYEIAVLDSMRKIDMKASPNYLNVEKTISIGKRTTNYDDMINLQNQRIEYENMLKFNPDAVDAYSSNATQILPAYTAKEKAVPYIIFSYLAGLLFAFVVYKRKSICNFLKS